MKVQVCWTCFYHVYFPSAFSFLILIFHSIVSAFQQSDSSDIVVGVQLPWHKKAAYAEGSSFNFARFFLILSAALDFDVSAVGDGGRVGERSFTVNVMFACTSIGTL